MFTVALSATETLPQYITAPSSPGADLIKCPGKFSIATVPMSFSESIPTIPSSVTLPSWM